MRANTISQKISNNSRNSILLQLFCFSSAANAIEKVPDLLRSQLRFLSPQTPYYARSAHRLPMASTTKVMTALVAIKYGNLDAMIQIPNEAVGIEAQAYTCKKAKS